MSISTPRRLQPMPPIRCFLVAMMVATGCRHSPQTSPAAVAGDDTVAEVRVSGPGGGKYFVVILGTEVPLQVAVRSSPGGEDGAPRPSFVSRAPGIVAVDSAGSVRGVAMGRTFVVATLGAGGRVLADSVEVRVECTAEFHLHAIPRDTTLAVGESFVPRMEMSTCGGRVKIEDVLTWRADDPRVVRVDAETGRTAATAPGDTWLFVRGRRHGEWEAVHVTVRARR